ncbi:hypothetical protein [Sulfurovum sp.]|uniref:hypothetical protein n=1 Tax=Sulfurovum sp. TaxID=1969726 RepID=UPI0025FBABB4|nr:hypothetical protein [Sulfurovum sp.]
MTDEMMISEKKLEKLAKRLCKAFGISKEEAYELIYEEWDLVENLFFAHKKAKAVSEHFIKQTNELYRIA